MAILDTNWKERKISICFVRGRVAIIYHGTINSSCCGRVCFTQFKILKDGDLQYQIHI